MIPGLPDLLVQHGRGAAARQRITVDIASACCRLLGCRSHHFPRPPCTLQKDTKTHTLVMDSIMRLRYFGVPTDYIPVR